MKYGCIGEHLKHSFSKEIHNALADYEYEICEVERERLDSFMTERNFTAINVTIPYKEPVMPHLYYIDEHAREIGAVNTIVNRGGKLYGYNTDFYGMSALISKVGVNLSGKKVAVLGSGGTSKTAFAVAKSLGAREVYRVSRSEGEGVITYSELYEKHSDAEVIINTTPVGMYPKIFARVVDIERFSSLIGVIDAVYNPLRSELVLSAMEREISAEGGLYMLVAQAVRASEIFLAVRYPKGTLDAVFKRISRDKENLVLTGMPACGKSTVGKILSEKLGKRFIDTDALIVEKYGAPIPEIFKERGEQYFRDLESEAIMETAAETGLIVATGGGAVLREENIRALRKNGRIYFIDRPLDSLIPTEDRPLSSDRASIEKRYSERYGIYCSTADCKIGADCSAEEVAMRILEEFSK